MSQTCRPSPREGLKSALSVCSLPAVTAVCSPRSHLSGGVFICDATGAFLLDPFLLAFFAPSDHTTKHGCCCCCVLRHPSSRGAFGCHCPGGIFVARSRRAGRDLPGKRGLLGGRDVVKTNFSFCQSTDNL